MTVKGKEESSMSYLNSPTYHNLLINLKGNFKFIYWFIFIVVILVAQSSLLALWLVVIPEGAEGTYRVYRYCYLGRLRARQAPT